MVAHGNSRHTKRGISSWALAEELTKGGRLDWREPSKGDAKLVTLLVAAL